MVGGVLLSTDKLQKLGRDSKLGSSLTTEDGSLLNTPDRLSPPVQPKTRVRRTSFLEPLEGRSVQRPDFAHFTDKQ